MIIGHLVVRWEDTKIGFVDEIMHHLGTAYSSICIWTPLVMQFRFTRKAACARNDLGFTRLGMAPKLDGEMSSITCRCQF